jgi:hypothetical protein
MAKGYCIKDAVSSIYVSDEILTSGPTSPEQFNNNPIHIMDNLLV